MEKFDLKKSEQELKQTATDSGTKADTAIFLILNNMSMYNDIVDEYSAGNKTKVYLMYQLNASIFKQLDSFGQVPVKQKAVKKTEESKLVDIINKVNKR